MLEHFPKAEAAQFIKECYRVLKPGGIIRIAVPDLEQIVNNYTRLLAMGKSDPDNKKLRADYDWIIIEMYDQAVRNHGGGEMIKYLSEKTLDNEPFILERIGHEGYMLRQSILRDMNEASPKKTSYKDIFNKIKWNILPKNYKKLLFRTLFTEEYKLNRLAKFRMSGEIHQWMYDIYSLGNLLKDVGFKNIEQKDFDKSHIDNWRSFGLDEVNNKVRKPDSLFVEGIK